MIRTRWMSQAVAWALLLICTPVGARAQVVETRKSEANPAGVIFKATLYGVGTGLVLGGAYALIEEDDDVDTGDALKWGAAIGAAGGLVVGLIYAATRAEPQGSVEELETHDSGSKFRMTLNPGLTLVPARSGPIPRTVGVRLMSATF